MESQDNKDNQRCGDEKIEGVYDREERWRIDYFLVYLVKYLEGMWPFAMHGARTREKGMHG